MSIQLAKEFMEKLGGDDTLRENLLAKGGTKEQRIDAFVATGQEAGFVFSRQDVVSLFSSASNEQLDDRELEQVVGGLTIVRKVLGTVWGWMSDGGGDSGGGGTVGVRG